MQKPSTKHNHMLEFIGRFLPALQASVPTSEPIRYRLGHKWLDLLIVYDEESGWDVQIVDRSTEELDLPDVYLDMRQTLRTTLAIEEHPSQHGVENPTIKSILTRLDALEDENIRPCRAGFIPIALSKRRRSCCLPADDSERSLRAC